MNFLPRIIAALVAMPVAIYCCSALAQQPVIIPAPPQLSASSYLLIDAETGAVLVEHNVDVELPPASLTKMMTSYVVSSEIYRDSIQPTDMVPISVKAWRMGGSKMFVREGTQVSVEDLLRGVIIQSGNDASVALAEFVAGSEDAFVDVMNQQAQLLGMTNTTYKNSTGWPADGHLTTARDLATLARALINDFPAHYSIYAEREFAYGAPGEKVITQANRNRLLFRDKSVDGIKTGHTEEAGYCLVASSKRDDMRLVSVVMGTRSDAARADESQKLLTYGFRYYDTATAVTGGEALASPKIWAGMAESVDLGLRDDLVLTVPRGAADKLEQTLTFDPKLKAPFKQYEAVGSLTISYEGETLAEQPLLALTAVEEAGFFARTMDSITLFFVDLFSS